MFAKPSPAVFNRNVSLDGTVGNVPRDVFDPDIAADFLIPPMIGNSDQA